MKKQLWSIGKNKKWNDFKNTENFKWLKVPTVYVENSRSYFTELGYTIFIKKTFPNIKKYLDEKNINIECFEFDNSKLNIIYEDEHQIVIE